MPNIAIPRYKKFELSLFYFIVSKLVPGTDKVKLTKKELLEVCKASEMAVFDVFIKLKSCDTVTCYTNGVKSYVSVFESIEEHHSHCVVIFKNLFLNGLLELKSSLSSNAVVMFGLNNVNAIKLYNLFSTQEKNNLYMTKAEIRAYLGYDDGMQWAKIYNTILLPGIKSINKVSDLRIIISDVVEKRYPKGFMFSILKKKIKPIKSMQ